MIEGNRLVFGFGDVAIGAIPLLNVITFRAFKPPMSIGDNVPDGVEWLGNEIRIKMNMDKYIELQGRIKELKCDKNRVFNFDKYTFDFTNYNESSIDVLLDKIQCAMRNYFFCMAC